MKKDGYSRPGFFGTINHYDASGKKGRRKPTRIFWRNE